MASLTNTKIKDTYDGLLKTTDNAALGGTYKLITDGLGNSSGVYLGTGGNVGIGASIPSTKLHVYESSSLDHITIDGNNGDNRNLRFATENSTRWNLYTTSTSESGSNVGSDLSIAKYTDSGTYNGEAMTILRNSGNVGIGTTDPQKKLVISESTNATIRINSTKNGTWSAEEGLGHLEFFSNDTSGEGAAVKAKISATSKDTFGAAFNLTFGTTDGSTGISERMRIRYDGFVGIGETSPDRQLHLKSSLPAIRLEDSDVSGLYHEFFASTAGMFQFKADGGNVQAGSGFLFEVDGSEKMRIDSGGNVLIGKTSSNTSTVGIELGGSGYIYATRNNNIPIVANREGSDGTVIAIRNDNSTVGSISVSGSTTSYNETSDYRLKENVVDLTGALDKIEQLQPKRFNFISEKTTVDGFIAHEVQSVIPEAVFGEKDAVDEDGNPEYQGIDKSKIVPLLVGAIKELKAEIETLKSQINS